MGIFDKNAARITGVYILIGFFWIFLSDNIAALIAPNIAVLTLISSWKGIAFVLVSALVVYLARLRHNKEYDKETGAIYNADNATLSLIFAAIAAIIVTIGIIGASHIFSSEKDKAVSHLKTVANLKANEIQRWIKEREGDAEFLRTATFFVKPKGDWKNNTDEATKQKVLTRLEDIRLISNYRSVFLTDENGCILLHNGKYDGGTTETLRNAIKLALQTEQTVFTDIYRLDSTEDKAVVIDFISPTKSPKGAPKTVIVLRADTREFLYPFIQSWPIKSETAENLLLRKDTNGILLLNDLRHRNNAAMSLKMPNDKNIILPQTAADQKANQNEYMEGIDYRGIPTLGVIRGIAGTPWYLVSKQDESEVYAHVRLITLWIGIADALTIVIVGAAMLLFYQQKELQFAHIREKEQAEKLRALQLLNAISESSTDAIFAKDINGKYILANKQTCFYLNRSKEEIIGHDDTELFSAKDAQMIRQKDIEALNSKYPTISDEELLTADGQKTFFVTKGALRNDDQTVIGTFGVSRDITGRKAAEERINELNRTLEQKVEEEVAKNREKDAILIQQSRLASMGEMLSVVAHHWRQPLNALGLIIQDVKEAKKYDELTNEYIDGMIDKSMEQINFMSKTIDDFRNFFKSKQNGETFLLRDTIGDVLRLISPQLEADNIKVSTTCDKDMTKCAECDTRFVCGYKSELSRVILNAILNAKDAINDSRTSSEKDGLITVSFTHPKDSHTVIVTISDNGGGIDEKVLPKIFEPYFTTKEQGKGTGVGLYMGKVIIERNFKGKISAQNIDGGAQITIELPLPVSAKDTGF